MLKSLYPFALYTGASRSRRAMVPARMLIFSPLSFPTTRISIPTAAASGASGTSLSSMNLRSAGSNRMNPKSWMGSRYRGCTFTSSRFRNTASAVMGPVLTTCRLVRMIPRRASTTNPVA